MQLCGTEVQGCKKHKVQNFSRAKVKSGEGENKEVNSMIRPNNELN